MLIYDDEISELSDKVKELEKALEKAVMELVGTGCPRDGQECRSEITENCADHWRKWLSGG